MKVCPTCNSHFEEAETFCPHDGARLNEAPEHAPGRRVGETLGGYELESLLFADSIGERYRGKRTSDGVRVRVTVFSDAASPDPERAAALESTRALIGDSPPKAIGRLLDYDVESTPAYVVEGEVEGESLADARTRLDGVRWEHALRSACSAARAVEWLHRAGVAHRTLHPHAIVCVEEDEVTLFEWAHGVLLNQTDVMEIAALGEPVAYPGYIAPELTRPSRKPNEKTAVFSLGMIAYEAITGRDIASGDDAETVLKRHRRERPLALSLAAPDAELPAGFDEVFNLVIERSSKRRFQALDAMINALSGLLGDDPDRAFPQLSVDDTQGGVDDASKDTEQMDMSVLDEDKPRRKPKPDAGGSRTKKKRRRRKPSADADTAKVVVDSSLSESKEGGVSGSSETSDSEAPPKERRKRRRRKTDGDEDGERRPRRRRPSTSDGEADGESPRPRRRKRRRRRTDDESAATDATSKTQSLQPDDSKPEEPVKADAAEADAEADAKAEPQAKSSTRSPDEAKAKAESDSTETDAPRKKKRRRRKRKKGAPRARQDAPVDPTPQRDEPKARASSNTLDKSTPRSRPAPKPAPKAAAVANAASSSGEASFDDSWFSNNSTEKAWDAHYLKEHRSSVEQRHNRRLLIALLILVVGAIGFIVYSLTYEDPPEEKSSIQTDRGAYALHIPTQTTRNT